MEDKNTKTPEIVEDMPDFEENTAEMPSESAESVTECTDDAENEILSENNSEENEENAEKPIVVEAVAEDKSNLPTGFSFNPLVIAIKPFYDKLIAEDKIFADVVKEREGRAEKPKSLAECAEYIMGEAYEYARNHKQGNFGLAGFPDEDMYRLIRHYYDEEFITIHKITGAKASVTHSAPKTDTKAKETAKKGKDKPKPPKNVVDIRKAISAPKKATEDGKKPKREKKKDNLMAGFVPMERPDTLKDAQRGSREQAKSVQTIDMFADFFATEE